MNYNRRIRQEYELPDNFCSATSQKIVSVVSVVSGSLLFPEIIHMSSRMPSVKTRGRTHTNRLPNGTLKFKCPLSWLTLHNAMPLTWIKFRIFFWKYFKPTFLWFYFRIYSIYFQGSLRSPSYTYNIQLCFGGAWISRSHFLLERVVDGVLSSLADKS
jgi:hypothetical protein